MSEEQGINLTIANGEAYAVKPPQRLARVGDIVGYVLTNGFGMIRPAIVVRNWNDELIDGDPGTLQLQVFTDGDGSEWNDGLPNVVWRTSVTYDPKRAPGTWHWLDRD